MKPNRVGDSERSLAVFIDFENMGLGFNNRRDRFEIGKVLERLVEKGKIVAKKAYADWSRFGMYTGSLHESAIELVEIPRRGMSGKNSADIRLVVDAIDLAYSKDHIDTFVIVSGDSDFSPLVSKLKELGKHVIGLGLVDATSDLLRDNCDEFIYYEDLDRAPIIPVAMNESIPDRKRKVFALLLDSLLALRRENKEVIFSSMVKDTMKRKKPSFNEEYYGYRAFSDILEDAAKEGLLEIEKHKSNGMYVVARFGLEMKGLPSAPVKYANGEGNHPPARKPEPNRQPLKPAIEQPRPAPAPVPVRTPVPEPARKPVPAAARHPVQEQPRQNPLLDRRPAERQTRSEPLPPATPPLPFRPVLFPHPEDDRAGAIPERALGRELAEEVDLLDDDVLDEIPSYRSAKPAAGKPPVAPKAGVGKSPGKPRSASPAKAKAAAAAPAPVRRQAQPNSPPPPAPIKPKPAPKPVDEDDFGAGLDV